ncbi:heparan sulfate glucosamine 3-O-sulfotransferase 5-like isoform X2 [Lytechinus pictus]
MLRDTFRKNHKIAIIVIMVLVVALYLFPPTHIVSKKTSEGELGQRNVGDSPLWQERGRNKTEPKKLYVRHPSVIKNIRKKSQRYRPKSRTKIKPSRIFYGDCYAYSSEGARVLPLEVLKRHGCEKRLPKAMVIGIKKCGTMTLTHYLSLHPMVVIRGEVSVPQGTCLNADDIGKWREQMQWSSPRMVPMIGKPINMANGTFELLKYLLDSNAKTIMIIRDPVVRAVSDHVHTAGILSKSTARTKVQSFENTVINHWTGQINEDIPYVVKGRYVEKFRTTLRHFGRDRILILDGEAFVQDPLPIMIQTEIFLGLPPFFERKHFIQNPKTGFYCANVPQRPNYKCANPKIKGRPHPEIREVISKKLYDYYRPYSMEFMKEANVSFKWLLQ